MGEESNEIGTQKRSDNCLKLLQDTAKAVSSGVSYERFNEIAPIINSNMEVYDHFQNLITECITDGINYGFEQMKIAEKMEYLDGLAKDTPKDVVAWRPVTGNVDISAIEQWGLTLRKLSLNKKLDSLNKENERLRRLIVEKRNALQKNKEELNKVSI